MNKQNAHLYLPLVQALADGKTLQYQSGYQWHDFLDTVELGLYFRLEDYRIKPEEPRTFTILRNKYSGAVERDMKYVPESWERITVQEVLE